MERGERVGNRQPEPGSLVTQAEADEHRQMQFARFDADDDGQVTAEELQAGMKKFGRRHHGGGMGFHH